MLLRTLRVREAAAANVYVTGGRESKTVARLQSAANDACASGEGGVILLNSFVDQVYDRSSFSFGGSLPLVAKVVTVFVEAVFNEVALTPRLARDTGAEHPALGVVDHVSLHPLLQTPLIDVGSQAQELGRAISSVNAIPLYLYGAARPDFRSLSEIRRASNYFASNRRQLERSNDPANGDDGLGLRLVPDIGAEYEIGQRGVMTLGAVQPVLNFNIRLACAPGRDDEYRPMLRRVARRLSARGGGLAGVEALALPYLEGKFEIACNLLDQKASPPSRVLARVKELLGEEVEAQGAASGEPAFDPVLAAVGVFEPTQHAGGALPPPRITHSYTIGLTQPLAEAMLETHFHIDDSEGVSGQ